jgi:hypothetical protein
LRSTGFGSAAYKTLADKYNLIASDAPLILHLVEIVPARRQRSF